MAYIVTDIDGWAKTSEPLSAYDEAKKKSKTSFAATKDLHLKLFVERKSVEWQLLQESLAFGQITITDVGDDGDQIEVFVDDPLYGSISLGSYTKTSADTTVTILAASITAVINQNTYGYIATSALGVITIISRSGLGNTLIFRDNLSIVLTPIPIFVVAENGDILITENGDGIIIE